MASRGWLGAPGRWLALGLASTLSTEALAQTDREALERLEQERAMRQQREATAMAPVSAPQRVLPSWQPVVTGESPCFAVHRIVWADASRPELASSSWLLQDPTIPKPGQNGTPTLVIKRWGP